MGFLPEIALVTTRRSGVTSAAGGLQRKKIIEHSRGRIRIVNERQFEETACSSYELERGIYKSNRAKAN